jgi:hypothetical protein
MGQMSVSEYHDRFTQLARYAPNEVREDADRQRLFLKGIYYDLRLQLKGNKAIMLDNERREMDRKRKMKGQSSESNNRQRTNSQHGFHQKFQGPVSQWNRNPNQRWSQNWQNNQSQQRSSYPQRQQYQQNGQQTPRTGNPNATPMKNSAPNTPTRYYVCGKEGHMSYHCPEKQNQQTPQS